MTDLFKILAEEKKFRQDQVFRAWFDVNADSYEKITTLPANLREKLKDKPWLSVKLHTLQKSKIDDTQKALLKLEDGQLVEAVLMGRKSLKTDVGSDRHTICISSQVGCGMKCAFCATGKAGFSRNLTVEEIVDQYRFWSRYLNLAPTPPTPSSPRYSSGEAGRAEGDNISLFPRGSVEGVAEVGVVEIDNVVIMGQGEPLLNYENIKTALNIILKYTNIGPSKITMSTCGIPAAMDKLVADKDFPPVRFALSLHSAVESTRAKIMPLHQKGFLTYLADWAKKYHSAYPSRAHFIGLEYIMLNKVNDNNKDLKALIKLAAQMGRVRINLIPYNSISPFYQEGGGGVAGEFIGSPKETIEHWHAELMKAGFVSTIRYSQGQDIAAACGQLRNLEEIK